MAPMFSIIIPVYNVEEYLDRCVQSVINQTYSDIEVILVDDGSLDNSPRMCDEYARQNAKIRVLHKSNGGLSDARNEGLRIASGKYVMFLDSDDSIVDTACEKFAESIENHQYPDIVLGQTVRISNGETSIINPYLDCNDVTGSVFLFNYLKKYHFFCMLAPNNIYKRNLLIDNGLFFEKGLLHEDERWTPVVFLRANNVASIQNEFYNYFIRENSITTKKDKTLNGIHLINTAQYLAKEYEKIDNMELKRYLMDYNVSLYFSALKMGNLFNKKEYINRKFVWTYTCSLKKKLQALVFCVCPKFLSFLMDLRLKNIG